MARKSRKGMNSYKPPCFNKDCLKVNSLKDRVMTPYHTAVYARLSLRDNGGKSRDSIENQVAFLKGYLEAREDLQLCGIFCDNGYTGTDFERPGWKALIQEAVKGRINCILVKDLSRLGRDYIDTGNYLENVFPRYGIRLIAVNDSYDSMAFDSGKEEFALALKNIVNSFYARDISKKVSVSLRLKQKQGRYQGSHPPYGYLYSLESREELRKDETAAPIVQRIFKRCLEGYGDTETARQLNEEVILSPNSYFYRLGLLHADRYAVNTGWKGRTIERILKNEVYTGCMVRGKTEKSKYENKPKHKIPEEEWIRVPDTHDGIVEEELFRKVQIIRNKSRNPGE